MFSVVCDLINTSQKLNNDSDKFGLWANKWKMPFNPDPSKKLKRHDPLYLHGLTLRILKEKIVGQIFQL